jgi:hypothetical protein
MRLALYLDSIQQTPNVSGNNYREYVVNLSRQLEQLAPEQRKHAKRLGRMRIRECGDLNAAASHLVPVPAKKILMELAFEKRREKARRRALGARSGDMTFPNGPGRRRKWPKRYVSLSEIPCWIHIPARFNQASGTLGHRKTPKNSTKISIPFRRSNMNSDISLAAQLGWKIFPLLHSSRFAVRQPLPARGHRQ